MGGYWENKKICSKCFWSYDQKYYLCVSVRLFEDKYYFVLGPICFWSVDKNLGKKAWEKACFLSQDNNLPIFGKQVRAHFWKTHHSWRHCFTSLTFENVVLWPFFTPSRHDFFLSYDKIFFVSRGFWLTTGHNTLTLRPGTLLTEHWLLYVHCWTFWEL